MEENTTQPTNDTEQTSAIEHVTESVVSSDTTSVKVAHSPVSFDDISIEHLAFSPDFKVVRGSATQIVAGLKAMNERTGSGENEYQKNIYPKLKSLIEKVVNGYTEKLLTTDEGLQRQVFGANLNGIRNDGRLNFPVGLTDKGAGRNTIKPNLTYTYLQFGPAIRLLSQRLKFISNRDPMAVQRYKDNDVEREQFVLLKTRATEFLTFLETVKLEWHEAVQEARKTCGIVAKTEELKSPSSKSHGSWHHVKSASLKDKKPVVNSTSKSKVQNTTARGSRGTFRGRGRGGFRGGRARHATN